MVLSKEGVNNNMNLALMEPYEGKMDIDFPSQSLDAHPPSESMVKKNVGEV